MKVKMHEKIYKYPTFKRHIYLTLHIIKNKKFLPYKNFYIIYMVYFININSKSLEKGMTTAVFNGRGMTSLPCKNYFK
jgi:hypothetical protein